MATNTCPVILYPQGVIVGSVTSGKRNPKGRVRHVAKAPDGARVGAFDTFREASKALKDHYLSNQ